MKDEKGKGKRKRKIKCRGRVSLDTWKPWKVIPKQKERRVKNSESKMSKRRKNGKRKTLMDKEREKEREEIKKGV